MNVSFDPKVYGPVVAELWSEHRLIELGPGEPNAGAEPRLAGLQADDLFSARRILDRDMAQACLAGVWLYHNFLNQSHKISQTIATSSGSYWHGFMHRRELDFSNAKYWFRKVGVHPVYGRLCREAKALAAAHPHFSPAFLTSQEEWDPYSFVDFCEECLQVETPAEPLCRMIQQREWELLFDYCYRKAAV
ncbi:MAG TPA: hypothetical protein PK360_17340 [bacterium]|nr:hypothetical protein [bacterium]